METRYNTEWLNEKIENIGRGNGVYRLVCAIMMKDRLTYRQMYRLMCMLNRKNRDVTDLSRKVIVELAYIYRNNTGRFPEGFSMDAEKEE